MEKKPAKKIEPTNIDIFFYNQILKYCEENGYWTICPHCAKKVPIYMLLNLEDFKDKTFLGNVSRQIIHIRLQKLYKLGWLEKIDMRRPRISIKKYYRPKLKRRLESKLKKQK